MKTHYRALAMLAAVVSLAAYITDIQEANASEEQIYRDRNGYFIAVPPAGWNQMDYPSETVRSKIAFVNSREPDVLIRIIAAPISRSPYSLNDMYEENKQKLGSVLRPRFPSVKSTITKTRIDDRDAIVWDSSGPPLGVQKIVQYVKGTAWYQIAFSTTTQKQFDKYNSTFERFLRGFVLLDKIGPYSEQDARAAIASRAKRLAELSEKMGNIDDAVRFLDEGLSIVPNDKELTQYKKNLMGKSQK